MHGRWMQNMHLRKRAKKMARRMAGKMLKEYNVTPTTLENKPTQLQKIIDKIIYIVAIWSPLFTLPQVYKIYSTQDAHWLSAWTWGLYCIGPVVWWIYGFVHKDKPIIYSNIIWLTMYFAVFMGIVLYS